MINLHKPQVKALLDIMSSDDSRPGLEQAWIETINDKPYLVATDSYHAVCLQLDKGMEEHKGRSITRKDLTKFYKLMERGDQLDSVEVQELLKPTTNKPPVFGQVVEGLKTEGQTSEIAFNAKYAINLEKIAGQSLVYSTLGRLEPMVAHSKGNILILMPL